MKIALYIGDHSKDGLAARIGWWVTRKVQKGPYANVTHVEAIHNENKDGSVIIASASMRDNGVRSKVVKLNPEHWIIVDVPQWDVEYSIELLQQTQLMPYDLFGAIATVAPGHQSSNTWFCNEWVGAPYLKSAANFGPHHFAAVCLSFGKDITTDFFESRKVSV